jgi:hypothetical protein
VSDALGWRLDTIRRGVTVLGLRQFSVANDIRVLAFAQFEFRFQQVEFKRGILLGSYFQNRRIEVSEFAFSQIGSC